MQPEGSQSWLLTHLGFLSFWFVQLVCRAFEYALFFVVVFVSESVYVFAHALFHWFNAPVLWNSDHKPLCLLCFLSLQHVLFKWGTRMNIQLICMSLSSTGRKEHGVFCDCVIFDLKTFCLKWDVKFCLSSCFFFLYSFHLCLVMLSQRCLHLRSQSVQQRKKLLWVLKEKSWYL